MHVLLLATILIITYTRSIIKDFKVGYDEWRQDQIIQGSEPITQEVGTIGRLFEFETNALSFFNSVFIVIVIAFTFYIDLYFLY
jgi:hypothetical protein